MRKFFLTRVYQPSDSGRFAPFSLRYQYSEKEVENPNANFNPPKAMPRNLGEEPPQRGR